MMEKTSLARYGIDRHVLTAVGLTNVRNTCCTVVKIPMDLLFFSFFFYSFYTYRVCDST